MPTRVEVAGYGAEGASADHSQRGAPVRIAFFDDRIEIENPGILLPGMTRDDMRQGISKIRNHVIARVFRENAGRAA